MVLLIISKRFAWSIQMLGNKSIIVTYISLVKLSWVTLLSQGGCYVPNNRGRRILLGKMGYNCHTVASRTPHLHDIIGHKITRWSDRMPNIDTIQTVWPIPHIINTVSSNSNIFFRPKSKIIRIFCIFHTLLFDPHQRVLGAKNEELNFGFKNRRSNYDE